jgi:hypothetical protein
VRVGENLSLRNQFNPRILSRTSQEHPPEQVPVTTNFAGPIQRFRTSCSKQEDPQNTLISELGLKYFFKSVCPPDWGTYIIAVKREQFGIGANGI